MDPLQEVIMGFLDLVRENRERNHEMDMLKQTKKEERRQRRQDRKAVGAVITLALYVLGKSRKN
jgi:hypothetical protein